MITGSGLTAAKVTVDGAGMSTGAAKVTEGGRYAFVDLTISRKAAIGNHSVKVSTPHGTAKVAFELDKPLRTAGRFQGFSSDDVLYLIMVDRFADGDRSNDEPANDRGMYSVGNPQAYHGGDLQGVIDHLGYLKDLGVTTIWITPVYENVTHPTGPETDENEVHTDYHGYGATDFYAMEPHFGALSKFKELVDKAHALGLKVVQDQVTNHTSHFHPWLTAPPTPTWYSGTMAKHLNNNWQIWSLTDPHGTPAVEATTLDGWFVNWLPDLNQRDSECARYEMQNTLWWVNSTGIDGIREDTLPYVPRAYWQKWSTAIHREHPHVNAVGEVWNGDAAVVSYFQGGRTEAGIDTGVGSLFDFPLFYQIRGVFAHNGSFTDIATTLSHDWLYPNADHMVTFAGNHDVRRFMSEKDADAAGFKMAMTFLLTQRGIPEIYYGDEIGMTGGDDPDNRHDFPGGFPGNAQDAFSSTGRTSEQNDIYNHVRKLTHLRQTDAELRRGKMTCMYVADKQFVYARTLAAKSSILAFNTDSNPITIDVPRSEVPVRTGQLADALGSTASAEVSASTIQIMLPARSGALFVAH